MQSVQHLIEFDALFVDGRWTPPRDGRMATVVSPFTERPVGTAPLAGPADMDAAVRAARVAFDEGPWPRLDPVERADVLRRASQELSRRSEELTRATQLEVGSPLGVASWQPPQAARILEWHAAQAASFPWEEVRPGVSRPVTVRRVPAGVVAAIVAWNFPLLLTMPKVAPALLAGCTVVLKPAEETPLTALMVAEAFAAAGLPAGVLNVVPADKVVSEHLVRHGDVDVVAFTGSTRAGKRIGMLCAQDIRRCHLELGGKSAAIILDDADVGAVARALAPVTMMNNGQACVDQTRVLAPRHLYGEVVDALTAEISAFRLGDPLDPETTVGPLISAAQRERVEGYIAAGRQEGARVVLGGRRPPAFEHGFFVEPTVFDGVDNAMTIAQEEIFGPVVSVIPHDGDDDAVAIANDSRYGLSGTVWSPDVERASAIARRIRTGHICVNGFLDDLVGPVGGFKQSGIGREYDVEGIEHFVELQSLLVAPADAH